MIDLRHRAHVQLRETNSRESSTMAARRRILRSWPPITLGLLLYFANVVYSGEIILYDSAEESSKPHTLDWTTHIERDTDVEDYMNTGWMEATVNMNGFADPLRTYSSCYVKSQNVNNWLRLPYVERADAISLHINITFTMRRCTRLVESSNLQQCKETFNLFYFEAGSDFANSERPSWDALTYNKVEKIAADNLFENTSERKYNYEHQQISLTSRANGVYFAIQDEGACVTIIRVVIYYLTCPNITRNFAFYPETAAGDKLNRVVVEQKGQCVPNSIQKTELTYLCKNNGKWHDGSRDNGECACSPGYEGNLEKTVCSPCISGKYKWSEGMGPCLPCPDKSHSNEGAAQCTCQLSYYRSPKDPKSRPCTRPPSAPRNLTSQIQSSTSVMLTWEPPEDLGGRQDLEYRIHCHNCTPKVTYHPGWRLFNITRFPPTVTISNLLPGITYKMEVFAENGVTNISGSPAKSVSTTVVTQSLGKITNLRRTNTGPKSLTISWDIPPAMEGRVLKYQIRFFPRTEESRVLTRYSETQNFTLTDFVLDTDYVFMVRAETDYGFGEFSDQLVIQTEQNGYSSAPVGIIAGSIVAVILCMAIALIMIVILLRRNRPSCSEKKECEAYSHGEQAEMARVIQYPPLEHHINGGYGGLTMPLFPSPGSVHSSVRTYVDPHTYEDPNQAVREFTREIDACHITIESVIGGGEFGDVCKGKLRMPGRIEMTVAIKTLKPGATEKNRLDFLTEASIMGQFDDPNVIFLEGVVTKSNPIMIVTEYMANGSLDTFLRNNDGKFTIIQLVGMMRGVASGMKYLSEMGFVHRDLAARNILVNEILVCKVADFGLSREIESDNTDGAYTTTGGKIPVRWTAPEAIAFRKFTSSSDVWSYGVVMWEIVSYGERPYYNWSNQDVIKAVEKGYRLPPPMDCPEAIHQLMLDCWQKERSHRPKLAMIVKTLDKLIRAPELLRKQAKPRPHNFIDPSTPDMTALSTVEDWLVSIKMERYLSLFLAAGLSTMEQVRHITVRDLLHMGINLVGHQKKIMNSIQTFRAQTGEGDGHMGQPHLAQAALV